MVKLTTKESTPNADFLYGLLAGYENKNITSTQIRNERIQRKYVVTSENQ